MGRSLLLSSGLTLGVILAIGYLNLHTDEVPIVLFGVLVASFGLGLVSPKLPIRWALVAGLTVPASAALAFALQIHVPYLNGWGNIVNSLVAVVPGFIGAYLGAATRAVTREMIGA